MKMNITGKALVVLSISNSLVLINAFNKPLWGILCATFYSRYGDWTRQVKLQAFIKSHSAEQRQYLLDFKKLIILKCSHKSRGNFRSFSSNKNVSRYPQRSKKQVIYQSSMWFMEAHETMRSLEDKQGSELLAM